MWHWILFFFVTMGAKFILALLTIYLLLPTERSCSRCDEETLAIRPPRVPRLLLRCFFGRVQWRWCPRCGDEGLARTRGPVPLAGAPIHPKQPTRR